MASIQYGFSENYAWVDRRLEELYYGYALTADNCDEFQDAGLLREKWAWVDDLLRVKYSDKYDDKYYDDEEIGVLLCPPPLSWVDYRERYEQIPLEEVLGKRKRTASEQYDCVEDCTDDEDYDDEDYDDAVSSLGCDVEQCSQDADKNFVGLQFLEQSDGYESELSYGVC